MVEQVPVRTLTRNQQCEWDTSSRSGGNAKEGRAEGAAVTKASEDIRQQTAANAENSSSHYFTYMCVLPALT